MQPHASPIIFALLLSLTAAAIAIAVPHPLRTLTPSPIHDNHLPAPPITPSFPQKRNLAIRIKGLPDGYTGIFKTFISICPKTPATATFIRFFESAVAHSANDATPGRPHQRFRFGALALELVVTGHGQVVTREFVQAASLWLLDAAMKGWTGFFRAYIRDLTDNQVVEIRLATVFDLPAADLYQIET